MGVFQANIQTSSNTGSPAPSDSQVPNIGRGSAKPANIRTPNFLDGGPDLPAAVDQAILHGNGTSVVPELNETVTGNGNLKVTKNRQEWVKGITNSVVRGGMTGTYGMSQHGAGKPFSSFVFSSVYEDLVNSYNYAPQIQRTIKVSNSVEFGTRVIHRYSNENRTVHGAQRNYSYGDVTSQFTGSSSDDWVFGNRHDYYDQVKTVECVYPLNILLGGGIHLQTRTGAEGNLNVGANVVVALSESLVGLVNLEPIIASLGFHVANTGYSGVSVAADGANIRYILGIPVGPMRVP